MDIKNNAQIVNEIRNKISITEKSLVGIFEVYVAEAYFCRKLIDRDLKLLRPGDKVLEVGAGMLLLSLLLSSEGFDVTSLEPVGTGFPYFNRLQDFMIEYADNNEIKLNINKEKAENWACSDSFQFIFSFNVMEHVDNFEAVIDGVVSCMTNSGKYRFICPNYSFPYEPHFNIPTIFSKSFTRKVFNKRIIGSEHLIDPLGAWDSLNWITVSKVKRFIGTKNNLKYKFDNKVFTFQMERVLSDETFKARRGLFLSSIIKLFMKIRIYKILELVPSRFQPTMDCSISKE